MALALPIYLDHHATTPVDPRVLEAMLPYFTERFGNAASRTHRYGWQAEEAVEAARASVAALVGASAPREIVFTSGATESNNLALQGVLGAYRERGRHLVISAIEHPSVRDVARHLTERGLAEVSVVPVSAQGLVDPAEVGRAIRADTLLVSVMHANNEVGTVQPLGAIGALCRERGVLLHTDAAQSAGKLPLSAQALAVDLISVSAHKVYGPKGVGALFVRRRDPRVRLEAQLHGGGHERGMRSGTLPVPLIVGLGRAAELARLEGPEEALRLARQRDGLLARLRAELQGVHVNGTMEARLPGNLHVSFEGVDAEALILALRDLAVSSGSACASATPGPSHVLRAMGLSDDLAHGSIRFGLGRTTTDAEVETAGALVVEKVRLVRQRSTRHMA